MKEDHERRRVSRRVWIGISVCLLLAGVAAISFDHAALGRVADPLPSGIKPFVKVLSNFAEKEAMAFVILVVVALWGETRLGAAAIIACGGGTLVGSGLKRLVGRIRPDGGERSFPSTHAVAAFALAFVLARRFPRFKSVFYAGAALVALSRILLRKHYPSDVLTGAALGLATGAAGVLLACRIADGAWRPWPRLLALCLLVPLLLVLGTHGGTLQVTFLIMAGAALAALASRVAMNGARHVRMPEAADEQEGACDEA